MIDKKGRLDLFTNPKKTSGITKVLGKKISLHGENKIDEFISKISNKKILLDNQSCSIHYKNIFEKKNRILLQMDPTYKLKAIKNKTEIKNIKKKSFN